MKWISQNLPRLAYLCIRLSFFALLLRPMLGAQVQITAVHLTPSEVVTISTRGTPGAVLHLLSGSELTNITQTILTNTATLEGNGEFSVPLAGSGAFFRVLETLPETPSLTTIIESSPRDGERGVAVTRETILHFSAPLSPDSVLTTNHLYATFGGRRFLSRLALSGDRRKATLFYLEPLPGSTLVNVIFNTKGLKDADGRPLDPAGDGTPEGAAQIQFETLSLAPLPGTAVVGRVFDSQPSPGPAATNRPLAGVTITVDGLEQSVRAVTDTEGAFVLTNCPAGRFFVHIDGRTVRDLAKGIRYPDRAYYPFVGKAWDAVALKTNNLAGGTGEIFLPLIAEGTLQPVSSFNETTVSFPPEILAGNPALAGVRMTVPANSLFSDDGLRGGKVGIAPVPPDRLPGPLPTGLAMPLVITVQTDGGLNFDQPASICFPNLPDPVLKTPLPAGSKQALISFNHDKGIWEAVGTMTVSADGERICTDPGSGILQPGWHGVGPIPVGPPPCDELCCGGDDGDGGIPPAGRGAAQVAGNTPPPKCKSKPCRNKYAACLKRCDQDHAVCMKNADRALLECYKEVSEQYNCKNRPDLDHTCNLPLARCDRIKTKLDAYCDLDQRNCYNDCFDDCAKGSGSPSLAGLEEDAIADRISRISQNMLALLEPYRTSGTEMTAEVRRQLYQLMDEADEAAGGDAVQFLHDYTLSREEALAPLEEEFGENPGNAPPYPVLYAAVISRPSGELVLRGETLPYGQYSLFIPRDGVIESIDFYDPLTRRVGVAVPRLRPAALHRMRRFSLAPLSEQFPDTDKDALPDVVEFVYGTDPDVPDSDGDGILDGAEIDQVTDPLDGQPMRTGIIGTVKTPGLAIDVACANDLLAVAEGFGGVSLFNITDGRKPIMLAHMPMTGDARRVAMTKGLLAVASGEAGVHLLDIGTPSAPAVLNQFQRPGAQTVAIEVGVIYGGFDSGAVVALDSGTGLPRAEISLTNGVVDLAIDGNVLYALTGNRLFVISIARGDFRLVGSVAVPESVTRNQRLFVGGGIAYTVHGQGYNTVDVSNPSRPVLLSTGNTAQLGWRQIVVNGSGTGVAAVGTNPNSPADVALFDVSDAHKNNQFLTQFVTPGTANAVAIFNGLAYVADGDAGIQVVNYLEFDRNGNPPTLELITDQDGHSAEALAPFVLLANAVDDVQVRNVDFYVNGVLAGSDGSFPFEYRFNAPALTAARTNFTVRARAVDTGGNATWSDELTFSLRPDATAPRIVATTPMGGGKTIRSLTALFSEPMDPASFNPSTFVLSRTGPDDRFDTPDDETVGGGVVRYFADTQTAVLEFESALAAGFYRARVTAMVTDATGNRTAEDYEWRFRVANAVFWSRATDGFWEDPSNWSTGAVPVAEDEILIESIPGDATITHGAYLRSIKRLVSSERLVLNHGTWEIAESLELFQPLQLLGSTLRGGSVLERGDARLDFAPNSVCILDGLRVVGDLVITNPTAHVIVSNGLVLDGTVALESSATLQFSGTQTFRTGQIHFSGNSAAVNIEPGTILTLGPEVVVHGKSGNFQASAFGSAHLVNQGRMIADVAGGSFNFNLTQFDNEGLLQIGSGASMTIVEKGSVNTGSIQLHPGGTFTWNGSWTNRGELNLNEGTLNLGGSFTLARMGTVVRTGGTLNLNGTLELEGESLVLNASTGPWRLEWGTLRGGTLIQRDEVRLLFAPNAANALDGMRVVGDLVVTNTSARVIVRNGLDLEGSVLLSNAGAIKFSGTQVFNKGRILFPDSTGAVYLEPGTTLTLGPDMVLRGKFAVISASAFGVVKLINQGLLVADVPGGIWNIQVDQFDNTGILRAAGAGATIRIKASPFTNTGVLEEIDGGRVLINP